jgi:hypothetical protein
MPAPDNINGRTWTADDAAGSGSVIVIVGSYAEYDGEYPSIGTSPVEYGALVWTGSPF